MRKQVPIVEWTTMENDADWESQCTLLRADNERAANYHRPLKRYCWRVATFLILLVATSVTLAPTRRNEMTRSQPLASRQAGDGFQAPRTGQGRLGQYKSGWDANRQMIAPGH